MLADFSLQRSLSTLLASFIVFSSSSCSWSFLLKAAMVFSADARACWSAVTVFCCLGVRFALSVSALDADGGVEFELAEACTTEMANGGDVRKDWYTSAPPARYELECSFLFCFNIFSVARFDTFTSTATPVSWNHQRDMSSKLHWRFMLRWFRSFKRPQEGCS